MQFHADTGSKGRIASEIRRLRSTWEKTVSDWIASALASSSICSTRQDICFAMTRMLYLMHLQMISHSADGFNPDIGANACQLLAQEPYINLNVIFHSVRVISPYPGKNHFFGEIAAAGLEQEPHNVKFSGG